MKQTIFCLLLLIGVTSLQAQDKLVLRNGRTIEVKIQRSLENDVEYVYPGETSVYSRPKSAISYILYEDGRREICDDSLLRSSDNTPSRTSTTTARSSSPASTTNRISRDEDVFWQDVKTTFADSEVKGLTRINRVSAVSNVSYKDAIQQLKKKVASLGGTTVLVMDDLDDDLGEEIEVMGIAYRDNNMEYTPRSTNERNNVPVESSSNVRRRRIAQQMEGYNNDSHLEFEDYSTSQNNRNTSSASRNTTSRNNTSSRQANNNNLDAVHLMNGRIINGTIEELEPDDFVSIRTSTGRVYEYSMDDVKRISRGSVNNSRSTASRSSSRNDNRSSSRNNSYDSYSVSGYKGTFDVGYDLAMGGTGEKGRLEFHTSHGYQINEYLFAGAGVGLHMYSARDSSMKSGNSYPHYSGRVQNNRVTLNSDTVYMRAVDSAFMTLPVFIDIRGYLPLQNDAITPFVMLRVGYSFNLSDGFAGMGLYMNPSIGIIYRISPKIGLNLSAGYSYQSYGGIPANGGYGFHYVKDATNTKYEAKGAGGITFKLGVEF